MSDEIPDVIFASCLDLEFPGGVQRNLGLLRRALAESGVRVHMVNRSFLPTAAWKRNILRRAWRALNSSGEEVFRIRRAMRAVADELRGLSPVAPVIAFDAWAMIAAVRAGRWTVFRTPTPSWATEEAFENGYLSPRSAAARGLLSKEKAALERVKRVVVLSERGAAVFAGYGAPPERIRLVPNAIEIGPAPAERGVHPDGRLRLLWVGHIRPVKGLDVLVAALETLPVDLRARLVVIVVGGGADEGNPNHLAARAGLAAAGVEAEFRGVLGRDSVREEMLASDLFVSSSRRENFPNAVLEAMEAGLPVVATDVGASSEMLGPEGAAFLVPSGDAAALGDRISTLLSDRDAMRRTGGANRARARDHFSVSRMVESYRALLREAAAEETRGEGKGSWRNLRDREGPRAGSSVGGPEFPRHPPTFR